VLDIEWYAVQCRGIEVSRATVAGSKGLVRTRTPKTPSCPNTLPPPKYTPETPPQTQPIPKSVYSVYSRQPRGRGGARTHTLALMRMG